MTHTKLVQPKPANASMVIYNINALSNTENIADLVFTEELKPTDNQHRLKGIHVDDWQPLRFKWCIDDTTDASKLIVNDFVLVIGVGVEVAINEKAKIILSEHLKNEAQYLPIKVLGEKSNWYLLNIINPINNAISEEKSLYKTLSTGKRILRKPVFIGSHIADNSTFVIPPAFNKWYTKGEQLKELVEKHGLTGLHFDACEVDVAEAT